MLNRNFEARNFGLRSRDLVMAAKNALIEHGSSFSSIATNQDRFRLFSNYMKEQHSIKDLRWIEKHHIIQYSELIFSKIESKEISIVTGHNRISAVNTVMQHARQDKKVWVSPVEILGKRAGIRTISRALSQNQIKQQLDYLSTQKYASHLKIIHNLSCKFGLRFEEASKLNANKALKEATHFNQINVIYGTKGGRSRTIQNLSHEQISLLKEAAIVQEKNRSLIPEKMNYKTWRNHAYKSLKHAPVKGWHPGRHTYANDRYNAITGIQTPLQSGFKHGLQHHKYIANKFKISIQDAKKIDNKARLKIANELGHNRVQITNSYLG